MYTLKTTDGIKLVEFESTKEEALTEMEAVSLKIEEQVVLFEDDKEIDSYPKKEKNKALAILNDKIEQGVLAVFMQNNTTGGNCCIFKKSNEYYYADKSFVPYTGVETMIFKYDFENQEVLDWTDLYCDRTGKSLEACIEEFAGCKIAKKEYINNKKGVI